MLLGCHRHCHFEAPHSARAFCCPCSALYLALADHRVISSLEPKMGGVVDNESNSTISGPYVCIVPRHAPVYTCIAGPELSYT